MQMPSYIAAIPHRSRLAVLLPILLSFAVVLGCETVPDEVAIAATATDEAGEDVPNHASAAEKPNYAALFDGDVVRTITIRISNSEYKRMQADMVSLLGQPTGDGTPKAAQGGAGGGKGGGEGKTGGRAGGAPGGSPPQGAFDACKDGTAKAVCTLQTPKGKLSGSCQLLNGGLACVPAGGPGGGAPGGSGPGGGGGAPGDLVGGDPTWAEVTVSFGDRTLTHAGMRYKGNSSLKQSWSQGIKKLPFRITFDKFEDDHPDTKNQRLHGFKKLTFAPSFFDASFTRDKLMEELLVGRGIPAARTAYYRVMLDIGDGKGVFYAGLYTVIEDPSDAMLEREFGDDSGNLYKPEGVGADWSNYTGDWEQSGFIKKTNEKAADWTDISKTLAALHADQKDAAAWRAELQKHFDVDQFLNWLALNTVVVNWDVYGAIAHNYYVYHEPGARLLWLPWDHNMSLTTAFGGGPSGGSTANVLHENTTTKWPLIRLLLDDPVFMKAYLGYVSAATKGLFATTAFAERAQVLHDLVKPHVTEEKAPWSQLASQASFDGAVAELTAHVKARQTAVATALTP
ncbi:MAG: CotH kinase family protein [Myxococcales bacterium]|nr:CotH kinase family protein [Myxococcales bacterium]